MCDNGQKHCRAHDFIIHWGYDVIKGPHLIIVNFVLNTTVDQYHSIILLVFSIANCLLCHRYLFYME